MQIKNYVLTITAIMILLAGVADKTAPGDEQASFSRITFYVAWYDVGQAALEGLPGIKKVTKGFKEFREVNTVYYDPQEIRPEAMVDALKTAGTYQGVAEE